MGSSSPLSRRRLPLVFSKRPTLSTTTQQQPPQQQQSDNDGNRRSDGHTGRSADGGGSGAGGLGSEGSELAVFADVFDFGLAIGNCDDGAGTRGRGVGAAGDVGGG